MDKSNQYFTVGDMSVSMDTQDGHVVGVSAEDSDGNSYEGGFVFERIPGGPCVICRKVGGQMICQEIDCGVLREPASAYEKA